MPNVTFPVAEPGVPDTRSARRFLIWLARRHGRTLAAGIAWGSVWMLALALTPLAIGRAIDQIIAQDRQGILLWTVVLVGLAVISALGSIMRHRCDIFVEIGSSFRTIQLVTRHASRLGHSLDDQTGSGEVVAVGTTDIDQIGFGLNSIGRGIGAVITIVTVSVIMLASSLMMGLAVLVGVPLLLLATGPLLRPLHRRASRRRDRQANLTDRASDIVAGLRVLRGIGGEDTFRTRFRGDSRDVRDSGVRVAKVESWLHSFDVLLPGILVVAVVWIGAHLVLAGTLTPGELVAFYGYVAFLVLPMRMVTELVKLTVAAHVAARRVVSFLRLNPPQRPDTQVRAVGPTLTHPESGLVIEPGSMTGIVLAPGESASALADQLAGYAPSAATLGNVSLSDLPMSRLRSEILLSDHDARLFTGKLSDQLGGTDDAARYAAVHHAAATDIVTARPEGLDTEVSERGLSFSGGEQQRLRLARALLFDPPVLILMEPTSAVDALTESLIAQRLRSARSGRTTVIVTTSPLLLDQCDTVAYVEGGTLRAKGSHRELLDRHLPYASTVLRTVVPSEV